MARTGRISRCWYDDLQRIYCWTKDRKMKWRTSAIWIKVFSLFPFIDWLILQTFIRTIPRPWTFLNSATQHTLPQCFGFFSTANIFHNYFHYSCTHHHNWTLFSSYKAVKQSSITDLHSYIHFFHIISFPSHLYSYYSNSIISIFLFVYYI